MRCEMNNTPFKSYGNVHCGNAKARAHCFNVAANRFERSGAPSTARRNLEAGQMRRSQKFPAHQFFSLSAMEWRRGPGRGGAFSMATRTRGGARCPSEPDVEGALRQRALPRVSPALLVLCPFVPHRARKKQTGLLRQSHLPGAPFAALWGSASCHSFPCSSEYSSATE
jgi:hypothetical protein